MKPEDQIKALTEAAGLPTLPPSIDPDEFFCDRNRVTSARRRIITTPQLRVLFLGLLRGIIERRTRPVSDYDLLDATSLEITEAVLRSIDRWQE